MINNPIGTGDLVQVIKPETGITIHRSQLEFHPPKGWRGIIRGDYRYGDGQLHGSSYYLDNWIVGIFRRLQPSVNNTEIPLYRNNIRRI